MGGAQAHLTLASTSPQRRAILEQLRIPFEVVAPAYVEHDPPDLEPTELVRVHAEGKARSVHQDGQLTLGVDTTVAHGGRIYGKPEDVDDARRMLHDLGGSNALGRLRPVSRRPEHRRRRARGHESDLQVPHRPRLVATYLESGEWEGRAGGYAIQGLGGRLVERIDGDYLNVVGLPGALVVSLLEVHAPKLLETPR